MANIDKVYVINRKKLSDDRGWFIKVIDGNEEYIPSCTGEVYLTMGKAGESKGGHYHIEAVEWFTLIQGFATLKLEDIETHERRDIELSFDNPQTVFIPIGVAHTVVNKSNQDFVLLAYTDKQYNPLDTISYSIR